LRERLRPLYEEINEHRHKKAQKSQNKSGKKMFAPSCVFSWLKLFSMKPDDFEQMLRGQPARKVPAEWRGEILATTQAASCSRSDGCSQLSTLNSQLGCGHARRRGRVWRSLAVDSGRQLCHARRITARCQASPPPSPEVILALREQKQLLAELVARAK